MESLVKKFFSANFYTIDILAKVQTNKYIEQ